MRTGRGITIQQGHTDDATRLRVIMLKVAQKDTYMKGSTLGYSALRGSQGTLHEPIFGTGTPQRNGTTTQQ
jgi:hypothetical protein